MNYAKALAAVGATVLSGVVAALTLDQTITPVEWVNVAILGAGALGVFAAPNVPGARYTKAVLAVITAVLTLTVQLLFDGVLDVTDWLQLGVAALGALGVYAVPNSGGDQVDDSGAVPPGHLA
jgi:2-keto-3-deoxy-6-phosphogluconate aldolase